MAVWLVRAGSHGEYEQKFIQEGRVYVTWDRLDQNLEKLKRREDLFDCLKKIYPDLKPKTLQNWVSQLWPFAHEMKKNDLVILPSKMQPSIFIGEIVGNYRFEEKGPDPFYHWRPVKWIAESIPRSNFGQDLLFSFGAYLTICRIQRNNAEVRINAMRENGWKPEILARKPQLLKDEEIEDSAEVGDLEQLALDNIAQLIGAKFKGHGLARLVESILRAQGYTTRLSPQGPDGGIDILAGTGTLGFGSPRLCVQVKSQDTPIEIKALNELRGAMQSVQATEGLFVCWGGFQSSITKQGAASFFTVRLWTQKELLEELFSNYDKLDEEIRAEIPLKRIWTVAAQE